MSGNYTVCVSLNLIDSTESNQELITAQMLEMLRFSEIDDILNWSTMFLREDEILFLQLGILIQICRLTR